MVLPVAVGVIPFGLIIGVTAEPIVGPGLAIFMSAFIFAGASQLATVQLLSEGATWSVIIMTAMVINIRMVMYSASLEPHLRRSSRPVRMLMAFFLVDQVYALSLASFTEQPDRPHAASFYAGLTIPLIFVWMGSTVLGVVLGAQVPESWGLSFAVPLVFAALIFPAITDAATRAAAMASAVAAFSLFSLPYNLGLPIAACVGIAAGMIVEARHE